MQHVSILVSVDVDWEDVVVQANCLKLTQVSILVSVDVDWEANGTLRVHTLVEVSILVSVDVDGEVKRSPLGLQNFPRAKFTLLFWLNFAQIPLGFRPK